MSHPKHKLDRPRSTGRRALAGTAAAAGLAVAAAPALSVPAQAATKHHHAVSNAKVVKVARNQKGTPYGYGGNGPHRFDCSGLVQYVAKKAGRHLPRTSSAQYGAVKHVGRKQARAGDLVFFKSDGDVYHVGIKTGPDRMIDASRPGTDVSTHPIWHKQVGFGRL
ncbi:glycoside hydrolase [Marmoricola endophyticus]|uniref:Glycoside hydrolase n=1 Tax=Marmoricola endophyticus TaxID=2040280 RepID=A0A917BD82_9ACTN|nr:NlpC/P60 family protein [Marmoricola endophyticus]GGF34929.1 glycoside hydrolase [Marmoricola endophyticus]